MTRFVAYIVPALLLSASLLGCQSKDDGSSGSEFAAGVPRASTVAMSVPGSDSKALGGRVGQGEEPVGSGAALVARMPVSLRPIRT